MTCSTFVRRSLITPSPRTSPLERCIKSISSWPKGIAVMGCLMHPEINGIPIHSTLVDPATAANSAAHAIPEDDGILSQFGTFGYPTMVGVRSTIGWPNMGNTSSRTHANDADMRQRESLVLLPAPQQQDFPDKNCLVQRVIPLSQLFNLNTNRRGNLCCKVLLIILCQGLSYFLYIKKKVTIIPGPTSCHYFSANES